MLSWSHDIPPQKGGAILKQPDKTPAARRPSGLEENLKKALTELLILFLFHEKEHYIGELSPLLEERSKGALSIVFPYAAIYRLTSAGYLTETKKRNAPTGVCANTTRSRKRPGLSRRPADHL